MEKLSLEFWVFSALVFLPGVFFAGVLKSLIYHPSPIFFITCFFPAKAISRHDLQVNFFSGSTDKSMYILQLQCVPIFFSELHDFFTMKQDFLSKERYEAYTVIQQNLTPIRFINGKVPQFHSQLKKFSVLI